MSQAWTAFPNWYPDPLHRHQWRWFDGAVWTEHVASHGYQGIDHLSAPSPLPMVAEPSSEPAPTVPLGEVPARIVPDEPDPADLRESSILLVDLLAARRSNGNGAPGATHGEVAVWSPHGPRVGTVRLLPDPVARVTRLLTAENPTTSAHLQILGRTGEPVLEVSRPARHLKVRIEVRDATGAEVGTIAAHQVVSRVCYRLEAGGEVLGTVEAPDWRSWQIAARDRDGRTVGRVSRTWEVLAARQFTPPDAYVVQIQQPLPEPLRSLVLASLLTVETALQPTPARP